MAASPKYHAFVCTAQRPPGHPRGCCSTKGGGRPLLDRLFTLFQEKQLWAEGISVAGTTCLGTCDAGPAMVVYPEGVWYRPQNDADIDEIVNEHFLKGNVVERLKV
jgi:(2Fe-2S) ferredoxin